MTKLRGLMYRYLDSQDSLNSQEMKKRVLILAVGILAVVIQLVLVVVYGVLGCPPMVVCTLVGAAAAALCCLLAQRGAYSLAGLLLTGGVVLVIAADDYFVGASNNSILYLFTVLVITLIIPYSRHAVTVGMCILLPLFMTGLFIFGRWHTPLYPLGDVMFSFAVANILITASGVILLVGLSRQLGFYVDRYTQERITALEAKSYRDALTGMYNRHYAERYFEQRAAEPPGRTLCVAMADLDDFKQVNDTYGHDAGDETLRQVSRLMMDSLRQSDLVIRWGGEEFVLLLQDVEPQTAHGVLEKIRLRVEGHTITHGAHRFGVTLTMGLALLDPQDPHSSLGQCDQKLYEGKRSGKNVVVH